MESFVHADWCRTCLGMNALLARSSAWWLFELSAVWCEYFCVGFPQIKLELYIQIVQISMADTCHMFNSIDKVIEWPILGHKPDIVSFTSFTMRANSPAELVRSALRLRVRQCISIDMSFYECIMEGGSPENFAIAFLWVLRVHLHHLLAILSRNAVTSTFIYQAIGAGIPMLSCLLFLCFGFPSSNAKTV